MSIRLIVSDSVQFRIFSKTRRAGAEQKSLGKSFQTVGASKAKL